MNKSYILTFLLSVMFIIIAFIFQEHLSHFNSLGLVGIFLINIIGSATLFVPAPAIASVVAGGVVYSPVGVAFLATLGACIGDMVSYFVGYSGKKVFVKKHTAIYTTSEKVFKRFGGLGVFVFAFIPNPVFDGIGIIAGVFMYSPYKFFAWMFAGRLLRNILLAFAGSQL